MGISKKIKLSALILGLCTMAWANCAFASSKPFNDAYVDRVVDSIRKTEGVHSKHPYGVLSVKTSNPRQVCENTVRNNYKRWLKSDRKKTYLQFLADRYCPPSVDPIGNRNWKINMSKFMGEI